VPEVGRSALVRVSTVAGALPGLVTRAWKEERRRGERRIVWAGGVWFQTPRARMAGVAVKAALRKEMKGRLRGLVGEERREQSQALVAKLLQLPAYKEARCRHLHLHLHLLQVGVPVPEPGHGGGHCGPGLPGAAGGQEVLRPQVLQ